MTAQFNQAMAKLYQEALVLNICRWAPELPTEARLEAYLNLDLHELGVTLNRFGWPPLKINPVHRRLVLQLICLDKTAGSQALEILYETHALVALTDDQFVRCLRQGWLTKCLRELLRADGQERQDRQQALPFYRDYLQQQRHEAGENYRRSSSQLSLGLSA